MQRLATVAPYHLRATIYDWHDPTDYWYSIVSGAARNTSLTADGRRHILEFLLPGDLFGFGAWDEHRFAVEPVVEGTLVARYSRRDVEALAESDPQVGRQLRELAFEAIDRLQERIIILGHTTARSKVASFLLEMAYRSPAERRDSFMLPMSRYDIADYLALAVETVCRTLTNMRRRGVIAFTTKRQVCIMDRGVLQKDVDDDGAWHGSDGSTDRAQLSGSRARRH